MSWVLGAPSEDAKRTGSRCEDMLGAAVREADGVQRTILEARLAQVKNREKKLLQKARGTSRLDE